MVSRTEHTQIKRETLYDPSQTLITNYYKFVDNVSVQLDNLSLQNETLKKILGAYRIRIENQSVKSSLMFNKSSSQLIHKVFEIIDAKSKTKNGHIAKYDARLKQFATYLYVIGGKLTYETLAANLSLPSVATVKKEIQSSNGPIIEGRVRAAELRVFLTKRKLHSKVWLSEDATRIVNKIQYDPTTDQIVGLVLPMDHSGMPISFSFLAENVQKMQQSLLNFPKAENVYTVMSRSLNVNSPPFCLSLFGTDCKFKTSQVLKRWTATEGLCKDEEISIFGWSSDGDTRCLRAMRIRSGLAFNPSNVPVEWREWFNASYMPKLNCVQDTHHICNKMKSRLYDTTAVMFMGNYIVSKSHLQILIDTVSKDKHLLVPSDIRPLDKMNFKPVEKIMNPVVREHLNESVPASLGTSTYLSLIENVFKAYMDEKLKPLERVYSLWYTIFFLRIWKIWLVQHPKLGIHNFITYNAYSCIELNGHSLINIIASLAAAGEDEQFITTLMGSQTCEERFRRLRSLTTTNWTAINFSLLEMLHKIKRIEFCDEAMADLNDSFNFPRLNTKDHTSYKLPTEEEIFDMVNKAKDDALRNAAEIGIVVNRRGTKSSKDIPTSLCCQLSSVTLKSDERESNEDGHFEDEDLDSSDDDDQHDSDAIDEKTQDEQEQEPEDINSILKAHGGSINLKEFTNVKGRILLIIFKHQSFLKISFQLQHLRLKIIF